MKYSELAKLSDKELLKKLDETEKELFDLRFKKALHQLDSPAKIRQLRHLKSQMKTVLRSQQLEQKSDKSQQEAVSHA